MRRGTAAAHTRAGRRAGDALTQPLQWQPLERQPERGPRKPRRAGRAGLRPAEESGAGSDAGRTERGLCWARLGRRGARPGHSPSGAPAAGRSAALSAAWADGQRGPTALGRWGSADAVVTVTGRARPAAAAPPSSRAASPPCPPRGRARPAPAAIAAEVTGRARTAPTSPCFPPLTALLRASCPRRVRRRSRRSPCPTHGRAALSQHAPSAKRLQGLWLHTAVPVFNRPFLEKCFLISNLNVPWRTFVLSLILLLIPAHPTTFSGSATFPLLTSGWLALALPGGPCAAYQK